MASRKKSCEKKVEKRQKRERGRGERENMEEPVGTPPLESQEDDTTNAASSTSKATASALERSTRQN